MICHPLHPNLGLAEDPVLEARIGPMVRPVQSYAAGGGMLRVQVQEVIPMDVACGIAMGVNERRLQKRCQQGHGHAMMEHRPHANLA